MNKSKKEVDDKSNSNNYELSDTKTRPILWSGIGFVALIIVVFVGMYGLINYFKEQREQSLTPPSPLAKTKQQQSIAPRLQVNPEMDLAKFRAYEDSLKNSYGWVVKEAGIVRIPVERAMELLIERGFPVRQNFQEKSLQDNEIKNED